MQTERIANSDAAGVVALASQCPAIEVADKIAVIRDDRRNKAPTGKSGHVGRETCAEGRPDVEYLAGCGRSVGVEDAEGGSAAQTVDRIGNDESAAFQGGDPAQLRIAEGVYLLRGGDFDKSRRSDVEDGDDRPIAGAGEFSRCDGETPAFQSDDLGSVEKGRVCAADRCRRNDFRARRVEDLDYCFGGTAVQAVAIGDNKTAICESAGIYEERS